MDILIERNKGQRDRRLYIFVSLCMIAAFIIRFIEVEIHDYVKITLQSFNYSEFLINYQGGFVRRGLLGELLYRFFCFFELPVKPTLTIVCVAIYISVTGYYLYQFNRHDYCWWLVLSPLFMGLQEYIIRKDFLLYGVLICILYLLRSESLRKHVWACIIMIVAIMIHEAFFLWSFPICALLLLSDKKRRILNTVMILLPTATFLLMCYYKGSLELAAAINDSWNVILPDKPLLHNGDSSIEALGWEAGRTFLWHLRVNAGEGGAGIVIVPLIVLGAYYLFTNFILAFRNVTETERQRSQLAMSLVFIVTFLFLIPMFTFLSCDVGRVIQYLLVTTVSSYLIIPTERLINLFPVGCVRFVNWFNGHLTSFLPPSRGILVILLFFLAVDGCMFDVMSCWTRSVVGTLWYGPIRFYHLFFG